MNRLRTVPLCQALDRGDVHQIAELAGVDRALALQIRDRVGDCGLCRLAFVRLARQPEYAWARTAEWSKREIAFYGARLGTDELQELL